MEIEIKLLQQKVNRLEETLKYLEYNTSERINTILTEFISNRAEHVAAQKKVLEKDENFYQHLLCNLTTLTESKENNESNSVITDSVLNEKNESNHDEAIISECSKPPSGISILPLNQKDCSVKLERKFQMEQTRRERSSSNIPSEIIKYNRYNIKKPDPLSVVSLSLGNNKDTSASTRIEYGSELLTDDDINCVEKVKHQVNNNENIDLDTTDNTGDFELTNVEFQQQQFYEDSDLEEVEEIQTSQLDDDQYILEKSWSIDTENQPIDVNEHYIEDVNYESNLSHHISPSQSVNRFGTHSQQSIDSNKIIMSNNKSKKQNKCKLCPAAFTLKRTLVMHMVTFHKTPQYQLSFQSTRQDDGLSVTSGNTKPQKRLFCKYPHCQKSYASSQNLKIHMRTHTGERPHVCSICQKAFADPSCLRRHTMYFHGMINTYKYE